MYIFPYTLTYVTNTNKLHQTSITLHLQSTETELVNSIQKTFVVVIIITITVLLQSASSWPKIVSLQKCVKTPVLSGKSRFLFLKTRVLCDTLGFGGRQNSRFPIIIIIADSKLVFSPHKFLVPTPRFGLFSTLMALTLPI